MPLELTEILAASAIITVGATVQATVGFGLGLVAAPVLLLTIAKAGPRSPDERGRDSKFADCLPRSLPALILSVSSRHFGDVYWGSSQPH